jgi:hypothetical protein
MRPDAQECTSWPRCALRDADLEKCEEHLTCAGILAGSDRGSCPICRSARTALYELKGMRSDRSH